MGSDSRQCRCNAHNVEHTHTHTHTHTHPRTGIVACFAQSSFSADRDIHEAKLVGAAAKWLAKMKKRIEVVTLIRWSTAFFFRLLFAIRWSTAFFFRLLFAIVEFTLHMQPLVLVDFW
jgi:hypothetical protein